MRWFFILLLLVNALYFGWQLRQVEPAMDGSVRNDVARIRLLSEVDTSLLLSRKTVFNSVEKESLPAVAEGPWCQLVTGIRDSDTAESLVQKLQEAGQQAIIEPLDDERVLAYELTLPQPAAEAEQLALISNLRTLGHTAELIDLNRKGVYVIGRYPTRTEMNRARSLLVGLFEPGIYQVVAKENHYQVWVEVAEGSESSNKIKQLAEYFPRGIKIEKKVCKGVASTGVRD